MLRGAAIVLVLGWCCACGDSTLGTDLGIVEPGCMMPAACYKLGADCPCGRNDVDTICEVCNPALATCICPAGTACLASTAVCVGRNGTVCNGVGARCLQAGSSCATGDPGTPPQLVGSGAAFAPRCAYIDDICCPGIIIDLGVSD